MKKVRVYSNSGVEVSTLEVSAIEGINFPRKTKHLMTSIEDYQASRRKTEHFSWLALLSTESWAFFLEHLHLFCSFTLVCSNTSEVQGARSVFFNSVPIQVCDVNIKRDQAWYQAKSERKLASLESKWASNSLQSGLLGSLREAAEFEGREVRDVQEPYGENRTSTLICFSRRYRWDKDELTRRTDWRCSWGRGFSLAATCFTSARPALRRPVFRILFISYYFFKNPNQSLQVFFFNCKLLTLVFFFFYLFIIFLMEFYHPADGHKWHFLF